MCSGKCLGINIKEANGHECQTPRSYTLCLCLLYLRTASVQNTSLEANRTQIALHLPKGLHQKEPILRCKVQTTLLIQG